MVRDSRIFGLIAKTVEAEGKQHLEYQFNYETATAEFFISPEKLKTKDFNAELKACLELAHFWELDYSSFAEVTKSTFTEFELELNLRGVIHSILREPTRYRQSKDKQKEIKGGGVKRITFKGLEKLSDEITNILSGENQLKNWTELPPNILDAEKFVSEIVEYAKELNLQCEVWDWNKLDAKGFRLTCAVGQNKKNSYLLLLKERQKVNLPENRKKIAIIGKGICFDTGGLSLKPTSGMSGMKFDMTGAGLVASVFFALAKNKFSRKNEVIAILPISENLIGSNSMKVDSVIQSYGGKFIEITNTDAEGRLLLAEAISYAAKDLNVAEIITVATLTGAVGYALGLKYAGVWASSEESWQKLNELSDLTGEHLWRLPLDKYYLEKLKSNIAELKNSATTGVGGASRAATFLAEFREGKEFIHLDIANVASTTSSKSPLAKAPLFKTIYFYLKGTEFK